MKQPEGSRAGKEGSQAGKAGADHACRGREAVGQEAFRDIPALGYLCVCLCVCGRVFVPVCVLRGREECTSFSLKHVTILTKVLFVERLLYTMPFWRLRWVIGQNSLSIAMKRV